MDVLGIEVDRAELISWLDWLMPEAQPFLLDHDADEARGGVPQDPDDEPRLLTMEVRDSFWIYDEQPRGIRWLDRRRARALPALVRRQQPTSHLWRTTDLEADLARMVRYLEDGRRRSLHSDVSERTWQRAADMLPGARRISGTFPGRSGPNCFGAVMAAAGVPGADQVWMLREPFEEWLEASTRRGGRDEEIGTVLVWRTADGLVQHAAVTIGDGFALNKPSQGWQSPTKILTTEGTKFSSRGRGRHLERHTIR